MKSIVIIDDHPAICIAIRSTLEKSGEFKVVLESDNGIDALEYLRKNDVDLVILDLELPRLDGFEIMKRIRAAELSTKVLFLSAKNENIYAIRALKSGAHGFIGKGKNMNDIFQAVKMVLSGYSFFPESIMQGLADGKKEKSTPVFKSLSNRELMIARLLADGQSNLEIGLALSISNKTVSTYKIRIFQKLNINSIIELASHVKENDFN
ncbi:response regulator transcription factor [Iodobacter ciconiae]|uniref:Response regulator transcription factor n=1 Tax=Iodobacter ciconiae TaxID=2496266 RepID=A0A3S8ZNX1_9NEIS|nr:response regulator transcription factor [Iodobacter ciconiae]AZN35176.1 response regulator transcription factor [Iodobacter ciconiae]